MRTLAKEFQILGYSRQLAIVWSAGFKHLPILEDG